MPMTIRAQFLFALKKLVDEPYNINSYNKKTIASLAFISDKDDIFDEERNNSLVDAFCKFLGLQLLK